MYRYLGFSSKYILDHNNIYSNPPDLRMVLGQRSGSAPLVEEAGRGGAAIVPRLNRKFLQEMMQARYESFTPSDVYFPRLFERESHTENI